MPARVFRGYLRNLPVLIADETLRTVASLMAGTGVMDGDTRRDYLSTLELQANRGDTPTRRAERFESGEDALEFMSSVGAA